MGKPGYRTAFWNTANNVVATVRKNPTAYYSAAKGSLNTLKGMRKRVKYSSRTKRRSRRKNPYKPTIGDSSSKFFKKITYKRSKLGTIAKFLGGVHTYSTEYKSVIYHTGTDIINTQKVASINSCYTGTDAVALFDTMYNQLKTTSPLYSSVALTTGGESIKFYIDSVTLTTQFTNQSDSLTYVKIYVLMAKTTGADDTTPIQDWDSGLAAQTGTATTQIDSTHVGTSPTTSKLFNIRYKVADCKSFSMNTGTHATHTFVFQPQSVVDSEYFVKNGKVRGLTYKIMVVASGSLSQNAGGDVYPSPVNLIYNTAKTYRTRTVSHYNRMTYMERTTPTTTVAAAGTLTTYQDDGQTTTTV